MTSEPRTLRAFLARLKVYRFPQTNADAIQVIRKDDLDAALLAYEQHNGKEEKTEAEVDSRCSASVVSNVPEVDRIGGLVVALTSSLRSGLLFDDLDEPLNDYGKRIVRKILAYEQRQPVRAPSERLDELARRVTAAQCEYNDFAKRSSHDNVRPTKASTD